MQSSKTTITSPAKVNLYLHVTGKREDGYHLLDSLVVFAHGIEDSIELEPAENFSFHVTGPFASKLSGKDLLAGQDSSNLVVKATHAFSNLSGIDPKISITLEKNIPPGAGLGGGSGDAATVFRALEDFYGTNIDAEARSIALLKLGADVPVCYAGLSCRFEGIGDVITPCPALPRLSVLLVWPNVSSITKDVFTRLATHERSPHADMPSDFDDIHAFLEFLQGTENTLTRAAIDGCAPIADALALLTPQQGCLLARMSGSGSCVYGLFPSDQDCQTARQTLAQTRPDWWIQSGHL